MQNELFTLLLYILTGIIIGIIFNIFRISRKIFKMPNYIVYIEDILFWIITGLLLIFLIYIKNGGNIRFYHISGLLFGCPLGTGFLGHFCPKGTDIKKKKIVKK